MNIFRTISDFCNTLETLTGLGVFRTIGDAIRAPADKVSTAKSHYEYKKNHLRNASNAMNKVKKQSGGQKNTEKKKAS